MRKSSYRLKEKGARGPTKECCTFGTYIALPTAISVNFGREAQKLISEATSTKTLGLVLGQFPYTDFATVNNSRGGGSKVMALYASQRGLSSVYVMYVESLYGRT